MNKKSIRFFNDREVRAVWDDAHAKWWFSATDIVRAINDEDDYTKCRNYWKYLKGKMAKEGIELVSITNHFKFLAPDGKQRTADALDADCVQTLAKNYPNNRARKFLDWFIYSDNSIDGQSKKKAYTLMESGLLDSDEEEHYRFLTHQSTSQRGYDRPHCRPRNLHEGHRLLVLLRTNRLRESRAKLV